MDFLKSFTPAKVLENLHGFSEAQVSNLVIIGLCVCLSQYGTYNKVP